MFLMFGVLNTKILAFGIFFFFTFPTSWESSHTREKLISGTVEDTIKISE